MSKSLLSIINLKLGSYISFYSYYSTDKLEFLIKLGINKPKLPTFSSLFFKFFKNIYILLFIYFDNSESL